MGMVFSAQMGRELLDDSDSVLSAKSIRETEMTNHISKGWGSSAVSAEGQGSPLIEIHNSLFGFCMFFQARVPSKLSEVKVQKVHEKVRIPVTGQR